MLAVQKLEDALVTLYTGVTVTDDEAQAAADRIKRRLTGVEVEVVKGGQPHYDYYVAID